MPTTLNAASLSATLYRLSQANLALSRTHPGDSGKRQPVHTVYGGAHLFKADGAAKLGAIALRALDEYAPTPADLATALDLPEALAEVIHGRVAEKLSREPVEDFRADFEDGYGNRPDAEEDGHAESCAREMAAGLAAGTLPPYIGIRIKPFSEELRQRSLRTLDLFVTALARETGGRLPDNFVVTLPKVTIPEQVAALADVFDLLEPALGLAAGSLRLEIMIETTSAILGEDGRSRLPLLTTAARGRCASVHFGTYDYTASCDITAAEQRMDHPACDFALHMMKVAYAGTGLWLSNGATNVLPVAPHRATPGGPALTSVEKDENRAVVHRAWRLHAEHTRHSLINAYYQGWDLHPAQFVPRYATVYAFFLEGLDAASNRLHNFMQKAAQATLVGDIFDDAATGQGLLNFFLRAMSCGAITEEATLERSGLTLEELRSRSFVKILAGRKG
ncbi:MAG TPA: phosphoenolpyruvate kinase [Thermoanaerobaculia bacterium]|jgi:citrate lyase beta subunit|nr:phosphoenolpyruvate kinase [Thermoanaerobaculia bacterium]